MNYIQHIAHTQDVADVPTPCYDRVFVSTQKYTVQADLTQIHYKIYRTENNQILYSLLLYAGKPDFGAIRYEKFWVEIKCLNLIDFQQRIQWASMFYANRNYLITQRFFHEHYYVFMKDQKRWSQRGISNLWVYPRTEYAKDRIRSKQAPWLQL